MPNRIEVLEAQAMNLSPEERADLAEKLWLSVNSKEEVQDAWDNEIERRIREIDAGEVQAVPWDTVLAGLRAKLG